MKRVLLAATFVTCISVASAGDDDGPPRGNNCDLSAPPTQSGEEMNHGMPLKIYPRAKDISSAYSGCQIIWSLEKGQWLRVATVYLEKGAAVRIWSEHSSPEANACRYKDGQVTQGDPNACPAPQYLIAESMPAGCVEKRIAGAGSAEGCEYE